MKIRYTGPATYFPGAPGRVVEPGEVLELHPIDAEALIREGKAEHAHRGRALRDGLVVGNRTLAKGEEFRAAEERIKQLAARGVVDDLGPAPAARPEAAGAGARKGKRP